MNSLSWIFVLQISVILVVVTFCLAWLFNIVADYRVKVEAGKFNASEHFVEQLQTSLAEAKTGIENLQRENERLLDEKNVRVADALELSEQSEKYEADGYAVNPIWDEIYSDMNPSTVVRTYDPLAIVDDAPGELELEINTNPVGFFLPVDTVTTVPNWEIVTLSEMEDKDDQPFFDIPMIECGHFNWQDHPDCEHCLKKMSAFPEGRPRKPPVPHSDVAENVRYARWVSNNETPDNT